MTLDEGTLCIKRNTDRTLLKRYPILNGVHFLMLGSSVYSYNFARSVSTPVSSCWRCQTAVEILKPAALVLQYIHVFFVNNELESKTLSGILFLIANCNVDGQCKMKINHSKSTCS